MSRIPAPPQRTNGPHLPSHIVARTPLARRWTDPDSIEAAPDPRVRGEPHTVDMVPSIRGSITLIGYDRVGDVMVEFRIPRSKYRPRMAARLERWLRENDDTPVPLHAI